MKIIASDFILVDRKFEILKSNLAMLYKGHRSTINNSKLDHFYFRDIHQQLKKYIIWTSDFMRDIDQQFKKITSGTAILY